MDETFFEFINEPNAESFLRSRKLVISHPDYNPYSDDLDIMQQKMEAGDYRGALRHRNINVILSPSANLMHKGAFERLGEEQNARSAFIIAARILENIALTGEGTLDSPFIVTRISDERDFLGFLGEKFAEQQLQRTETGFQDVVTTESGKVFHFDITDCYTKLNSGS